MKISITPDGAVLKDGEEIGNIVGGKCVLYKRPGPTIYKAIKDAADDQALTFDILPENPPPLSSGTGVVDGQQGEAAPGTLHPSAAPLTPEPRQSPALGDKDPAWQRWFIENHGEEAFKAKYPTRKIP